MNYRYLPFLTLEETVLPVPFLYPSVRIGKASDTGHRFLEYETFEFEASGEFYGDYPFYKDVVTKRTLKSEERRCILSSGGLILLELPPKSVVDEVLHL